MARGKADDDGRPPRHTFFYPQEEYEPGCLDALSGLTRDGLAEVEIHLHHRNDTVEGLRGRLAGFRDTLRKEHGLLGSRVCRGSTAIGQHGTPDAEQGADEIARTAFGFVHGNWALCNSRPDGDWCGVNEELGVLAAAGCYADFTFPSAPSPTQPGMVNAIYRAWDRPGRPRGHDTGLRVTTPVFRPHGHRTCSRVSVKRFFESLAERLPQKSDQRFLSSRPLSSQRRPRSSVFSSFVQPSAFSHHPSTRPLLLIQGPLGFNWSRRKWGFLPGLDAADISAANPPVPSRADLWARQCVHVPGRPEWVFVKAHTHGCKGRNTEMLLGGGMDGLHERLRSAYGGGRGWKLHYVTAREMYNIVRAAEDGLSGDPNDYRDYEVCAPPCRGD